MNHPHDNRIEDIYELSAMQQGMLFQRLYDADAQADTYFEQILLTLDGTLDVALWQQAWQKVTDRHGALRSAFHWEDLEQPLQIVERDVRLPWEFKDWRDSAPAARASRLDALLDADRARGIALDEAPLMRFTLIRWDERQWQLLWSHHHILFDGWSMAILLNEVTAIYEAGHRGELPALTRPPLFRDYIEWLQAQDHDAARAYWRQRLQGFAEPTPLPLARPAAISQAISEVKLVLAEAHTTQLRDVARRHRLTLNNLLQGAWALLLARYSRADEVVFGVTVSGRPAQIEGVGQMVGLLINTLPLRVRINEDQPVLAWLQTLQSQYLDQEPHQFLPLAEIQATSDVAKGHALFESILIFESYPVGRDAPDQALTIGELRTFEQSSYPLTLVAVPEATLELRLHYDKGRFDEGYMQIVLEQLGAVLHDLSRAPEAPLRQISLLGEADQSRLRAWNRTEVDRPADLTVVDLFERAVDLTPDATAVVVADTALSYAELERRANRVAQGLVARGVGPDTLVGLCVPRSLELVVGLLGILKAGGAYVPMDPEYPVERLRFMVEDAGAPIVLAHSQVRASLPHSQALVLQLDDPAFTTDQPDSRPARRAGPRNLAYVIYTSGSTGLPKGVAVEHGALSHSNFARLHHAGDHAPAAHTLIVPSFSFDAFSGTLWHVLTSGRTVELPQDISDLAGLQARIRHHGIDGLVAPPVWYQALLDQAPTPFPALRQITTGGEASAQTLLKTHFRMAPSARFFNEYGPTEAAVWCTVAEWTDAQQNTRVIGRPIANTRIHLLDGQNLPVPPGIAGELCIAGAGLARGYLNRPELTAEKFITLDVLGRAERLYRTGDLARWLPDGQIEFLGRIDQQVKLRGLRIELGEIESALCAHAAVRAAVVALHERDGQQALAGYVVLREPVDTSALNAWLKTRLPEYMVPASLMVLDALPVTPNGKVDRRALPEPALQEAVGRALSGPTEELLGAIWAEVLGRAPVSAAAHFFEMGGHSLLAIRVASRVRERFEIECPVRVLFERPVLGDLAAWLDTRQRGNAVEVIPVLSDNETPVLSPGQQRLWFLAQLEGASSAYNMPVALRLDGPLDESALRRSLVGLTTRQASLRQSFPVENGQPGLHEGAPWDPLQVVDLRQYGPSEQAAEVARRVHEHAHAPFDLAVGPLFKVSLLRLDDQANVLLLNLHHSVGDGWSVALLVREWAELYRAACTDESPRLAPLPIAYRDVAAWQQRWIHGDAAAQQLAWWVEQLQGAPALLELPADYPRPAQQSYRGASFFRVIPPELSQAVTTLAQAEGATVFMTLLSILQVVLHRYSGQDDLCIGTPMANRGHAQTEGLVGLFANTLVLRSRLQPDQPFADLLGQTRQMALGAFARQELPFERLVEALQPARSLAHTPLFQVMFVLQNNERVAFDLHGLRADLIGHDDSTAKFDLTLSAKETPEGIVCDWEFATDLFTPARIERLARHFEQVLRVITQAPETPVQQIELLTEADKAQLIDWNRSEADLQADLTVVDLFEQQADRTPRATAVVFEDASLGYAELDRRANQVAHALIARGVGPDTLVGLCVPRSLEMVVGLLGILKAGAAYVPLDPDYPAERLRFMVEDSAATVVLTHSAVLGSLPQSQADLLRLDDQGLWSRRPETRPHRRAAPADLAYAIYTSGSTGRPKGVMLPHGALANLIAWQVRQPALADACPTLQFTSLSFDVSFQEIFATWCSGGALVLVRDDVRRDAHALLAYLGAQRIERLYLPFVALHHLAEEAVAQPCDLRLRSLITAGEQLQMTPALRTWLVRDGITLHNHYGPTESHVVTAYSLGQDAAQWQALPPIGRPIANTRIHILDGRQQPVPPGNPGELCIAGAGLARGYLNRPELTAEKFITAEVLGRVERLYRTGDLARWLPDGTLEYLGRIDRQVKLRGFRIELGEIEAVVAEHPQVAQCVVTCSESDNSAARRLIGHVVVRRDSPSDLSDLLDERLIPALREFLKTRLPDHMVPAAFLFHEALPLTPNGKIDRAALAAAELAPQAVSSVVVAPRSVLELKILKIWQEVLKTDALDVHDNFFDVGGNSLMVTGLAARIERDLGERIPIVVLFRENSIARQAAYLQSDRACASWSLLVPMQPLGDRPPLFCVHPGCGTVIWYRHLARHFGQRQPLYALESQGIGEAEKPLDRIEDMASRYLQAIRSVQPQGPYAIAGWCFGALVAFEMAQQLLKAGEQVASLTFFDAQDPHQSFDEALLFDVPFFVKLFSRDVPSLEALQHEIAGLDEDVQLQRMIDEARRAGEVADDFDLVQARRQLAIFRGHIVGQRDYRVSRYPGKVAFIQAADGEAPQAADPIFGWGRYVGEVELHWVPGDHTGIMTEPHVGQLAETVERLLACSN